MMMKKITYLLLFIAFLSACKTDKQKNGCGLQTCTASFAYLGIRFIDKENKPISFSNFTAVNLRTNKPLTPVQYPPTIDFVAGFVLLASDANIKDFSTDGDDVKVSATNTATNQTKTATLKIAGGCGCHVSKVSGPDTVVFD
jgi:hypothetical protein